MFELNTHPLIKINVPTGLYAFDTVSGSGKTYLANTLRTVESIAPVLSYTFGSKYNLLDTVQQKKPKVLMVDRLDMYSNDTTVISAIKAAQRFAITLLDIKATTLPGLDLLEMVSIRFDPYQIEVFR